MTTLPRPMQCCANCSAWSPATPQPGVQPGAGICRAHPGLTTMIGVQQSKLAVGGQAQQQPIFRTLVPEKHAGDWCREWEFALDNAEVVLALSKAIRDTDGVQAPLPGQSTDKSAPATGVSAADKG